MGCYSIKEMVSRVLGKYNGKEKRNASRSRRMVYTPAQTYTHHRHVNFSSNNPIIMIPPEPKSGSEVPKHHSEPAIPGYCHHSTGPENHEPTEPRRTRFSPDVLEHSHPGPTRNKLDPVHHGPVHLEHNQNPHGPPVHHEPNQGYHGPVHHELNQGPHGPVHHEPKQGNHSPVHHEPKPVYRGPVSYYAPSPLPRWEIDRPRRQEYFSGEYSYYPTPIREGIYNIATDPHRLTNMFSEENPNACSIC